MQPNKVINLSIENKLNLISIYKFLLSFANIGFTLFVASAARYFTAPFERASAIGLFRYGF